MTSNLQRALALMAKRYSGPSALDDAVRDSEEICRLLGIKIDNSFDEYASKIARRMAQKIDRVFMELERSNGNAMDHS